MVAYRYLKRSVSHFFEMQGKTAVKAQVRLIHDKTDLGSRVPMPGSVSRTRLELSSADAMMILTADRFIHQSYGHMGLLAGLKAVFSYLNASKRSLSRLVRDRVATFSRVCWPSTLRWPRKCGSI